MLFPPVTITLLLVVVVAMFGGTLGVRELFVEGLTRIFEVTRAHISNCCP